MILYKYLPAVRIDILRTRMLKHTPPDEFNDPFEFFPAGFEEFAQEKLKRQMLDPQGIPALLSQLKQNGFYNGNETNFISWLKQNENYLIEIARENWMTKVPNFCNEIRERYSNIYGILCLSGVSDNILMWSHYADSHKGIVIGFDMNIAPFVPDAVIKVVYSADRTVMSPLDTHQYLKDSGIFKRLASTKFHNWEYEEEYRLFTHLSNCQLKIDDGKKLYLKEVSPKSIKEVIIGCKADKSTTDGIKDILNEYDLTHVNVKHAIISKQSFSLEII